MILMYYIIMEYINIETVRYVMPYDVQEYYWMLLDENDKIVQKIHEHKKDIHLAFSGIFSDTRLTVTFQNVQHWRQSFFLREKKRKIKAVINKYEKVYRGLCNDEQYIGMIFSNRGSGKLLPTASYYHWCEVRDKWCPCPGIDEIWLCSKNGTIPQNVNLYFFECAKCLDFIYPNNPACPQLSFKDLDKQEPTGIATCKHCTRLLCNNCIDCKACWFCKYEFENGIKCKPKKAKRKVIKKKAVSRGGLPLQGVVVNNEDALIENDDLNNN
jgi:hypothetical protein